MKFEFATMELVKLNVNDIVTTSPCSEDCPCFDPFGGGVMAD